MRADRAFSSQDRSLSKQILFAGDILNGYIEAALDAIKEDRVLRIIEESGGGTYERAADFQKALVGRVDLPEEVFIRIGSALIGEGASFDTAGANMLVKKTAKGTAVKVLLCVLGHVADRGSRLYSWDALSQVYMLSPLYEHMLTNAALLDSIMEWRDKKAAGIRVIYSFLDEKAVSLFWLRHTFHMAKYYPASFRDPLAMVRMKEGDEFVKPDPYLKGEKIRLKLRPSLESAARGAGARIELHKGDVYFDGDLAAKKDSKPGRSMGDDVYKMVKDFKIIGGRARLIEPRSEIRPYASLILARGHRYALARALPAAEYEIDFSYHPFRQFLLSRFISFSGTSQRLLGGRTSSNTWSDLLFMVESLGANPEAATPIPGPSVYGESTPGQSGDPAMEFARAKGLTAREEGILRLIIIGKSNQDIADELCVSIHTVKSHVHNLLKKTGVKSRSQLIAAMVE